MNQPKSKTLCLYFQLHQPIRLNLVKSFENIAKKNEIYSNSKNSQTINNSSLSKSDLADSSQNLLSSFPFDDFFVGPSGDNPDFLYGNSTIFDKVAATSYIPGLQFWLEQLKQFPDLKLTLGLSGTFLEQMEKSQFGVEILTLIRQLLATNRLEILAETYYHSLASLVSQAEFGRQIKKHSDILQRLLGYNPTSFRNTELIFNSQIGQMVESLSYKVQIISQPKKLWQNPPNQVSNSQNSDSIPNIQGQSLQNQNSQSPVFSKNPKKVQVAKVPNLTILGKIPTDSQNSQNLAISNSQKKSEWKNEKNLDLEVPNLENSQNLQSQFSNPKSSKIVFSSLNSSQLLAVQINPNLPAFSVLTNKNPKTSESSSKIKSQNQNSPQTDSSKSSFESKNNSHLKLALANFEATMFFFFTHRSKEFKQFFEDFDGNLEVLGTDFEIFGEHNGSHIFEIWSDLLRTLEPNWNFATVSDLATFESAELEKEAELKNTRQTNLESQGNGIKATKNLSNLAPSSVLDSVSNSFFSPVSDLISDSNLPIYQDIFENKQLLGLIPSKV